MRRVYRSRQAAEDFARPAELLLFAVPDLHRDAAGRPGHLRAGHRRAADGERLRALDHDLVADPDVVVRADDAGREDGAARNELIDRHSLRRRVARDPAARAGEGERQRTVLRDHRRELLARLALAAGVGVVAPHLELGVAAGGADVGLAAVSVAAVARIARAAPAEEVVARAVAEQVVGDGADRVVLALALAVGGFALERGVQLPERLVGRRVVDAGVLELDVDRGVALDALADLAVAVLGDVRDDARVVVAFEVPPEDLRDELDL